MNDLSWVRLITEVFTVTVFVESRHKIKKITQFLNVSVCFFSRECVGTIRRVCILILDLGLFVSPVKFPANGYN